MAVTKAMRDLHADLCAELTLHGSALDALRLAMRLVTFAAFGPQGGWRRRATDVQTAEVAALAKRLLESLSIPEKGLLEVPGGWPIQETR